jgi:Zn-dependent protease with chaperone function
VTDPTPTMFALETDSAWVVIFAVSIVTLPAAIILRRLIGRPGGLASGLFLSLPLVLPLVAAFLYEQAVWPEIAVLRPIHQAVLDKGSGLMHLLLVDGPDGTMTPYALTGSVGPWLLIFALGLSSFALIRRVVGTVLVHRLIARCTPLEGPLRERVLHLVRVISAKAGLKRHPEVRVLPDGVSGAFAVGARRGRILLSLDLLEVLEEDELAAILAHEIAHLESRDLHVLFSAGLLRDAVAWNPVAHIAFRKLRLDRELEADRRAADLTGSPLSVASGLLKVFELMRSSRGFGQRFALAFLRPGALIKRRVGQLLAIADGRTFASPIGTLPYLAAACLVAVMGLQAAARVSQDTSAFAFVWNAPESADSAMWDPKPQVATKTRTKKAKGRTRKFENAGPLRFPGPERVYWFHTENLDRWMNAMSEWTKRKGLPPGRWTTRESWEAVRISPSLGSFGIYRIDDLNEFHRS